MSEYNLYPIFSFVLSLLFLMGAYDAFKIHLTKLKLQNRKETFNEHKIHTLQSVILPPMIYLMFIKNSTGIFLWTALLLVFIQLIYTLKDAAEETKSRELFGGLSPLEYQLHLLMEYLKGIMITLWIVSKPADAYTFNLTTFNDSYPLYLQTIGYIIFILSIFGCISHVSPLLRPNFHHKSRL